MDRGFVPTVGLHDNSSAEEPYRLVATFKAGLRRRR
jgi:hypothetical protein